MRQFLALLAFLFLAACGQTAHTITYEVSGQGAGISLGTYSDKPNQALPISLTYHNASGGIEQQAGNTPWKLSFSSQSGRSVSVSVQKKDVIGRVTCRILVDGQEAQSAETTANYGVASCAGIVP